MCHKIEFSFEVERVQRLTSDYLQILGRIPVYHRNMWEACHFANHCSKVRRRNSALGVDAGEDGETTSRGPRLPPSRIYEIRKRAELWTAPPSWTVPPASPPSSPTSSSKLHPIALSDPAAATCATSGTVLPYGHRPSTGAGRRIL